MRKIRLTFDTVTVSATLKDTPTANAVWDSLPLRAQVQTWGDEVYFPIPVNAAPEPDARSVVEAGELCYWLSGACIAICFGPTPVSRGNEIRLASDANPFGQMIEDPEILRVVSRGSSVAVERLDPPDAGDGPPIALRGV